MIEPLAALDERDTIAAPHERERDVLAFCRFAFGLGVTFPCACPIAKAQERAGAASGILGQANSRADVEQRLIVRKRIFAIEQHLSLFLKLARSRVWQRKQPREHAPDVRIDKGDGLCESETQNRARRVAPDSGQPQKRVHALRQARAA